MEKNVEQSIEKPKRWRNRDRLLPAILVAVSIPLILCVAVPFEIYANNLQEFMFGVWDFLPLCVLAGILLTAINLTILLLIPDLAYRITSMVFLSLALLLFLQGTYLNGTLNSLGGDNLVSSGADIATQIFNILIWAVLIGGAVGVVFAKKIQGIVKKVALVLAWIVVITQLITSVFTAMFNPDIFMSKEDKLSKGSDTGAVKFVSTKDITTLSSTSNILYFCIDRFDEYYAEAVDKVKPELFAELDGFTHFKDNISLYGHTFPSVAYMLTNESHDIELSREDNLNQAFQNNKTLKTLHDNGYTVNLYAQNYYDFTTASNLPDYIANVSEAVEYKVTRPVSLAWFMLCLSMDRCFPFVAKSWFYYVTSASFNSCLKIKDADGYLSYSSIANKDVLDLVKKTPFKSVEDKIFSFIHLYGCHDVNVDYKDGNAKHNGVVGKLTKDLTDCFAVIGEYIAYLKEIDAYDNTTIIITGDHAATVDDFGKLSHSRLTALYVKPAGSTTEGLQTSNAPVTHGNIWATIMKSQQITDEGFGTSLFDIEEDADITREYIWHTYYHDFFDEYHYAITGLARKFGNWVLTDSIHKDRFIMS